MLICGSSLWLDSGIGGLLFCSNLSSFKHSKCGESVCSLPLAVSAVRDDIADSPECAASWVRGVDESKAIDSGMPAVHAPDAEHALAYFYGGDEHGVLGVAPSGGRLPALA